MVENTLNDFANLLSFDNAPGNSSRRKASDDFDVKEAPGARQRSQERMRGRTNSVRGERPKMGNLLDLIETTTDKLGRDLGLIEDNTMPEVGSAAYEQIRVTKLMNEDVVSQHNEPLTPLETIEEIEFAPKLEEAKEKPGNS